MKILKTIAAIGDQVGGVTGGDTPIENTIGNIINAVFAILAVVAVIIVIIGGILYMTAQGDPGKVAKGKNCIIGGIIGLVICLAAFAIVNFVLGAI